MITVKLTGWRLSGRVLAELGEWLTSYVPSSGIINARVVPSATVRQLNCRYAGRDVSTDVLSFSYLEQREGPSVVGEGDTQRALRSQLSTLDSQPLELGDVVLSSQHVYDQASQAGTTPDDECLLLLVHGCLHVLGVDHDTRSSRHRMDGMQRRIVEQLGYTCRDFVWQDV